MLVQGPSNFYINLNYFIQASGNKIRESFEIMNIEAPWWRGSFATKEKMKRGWYNIVWKLPKSTPIWKPKASMRSSLRSQIITLARKRAVEITKYNKKKGTVWIIWIGELEKGRDYSLSFLKCH